MTKREKKSREKDEVDQMILDKKNVNGAETICCVMLLKSKKK